MLCGLDAIMFTPMVLDCLFHSMKEFMSRSVDRNILCDHCKEHPVVKVENSVVTTQNSNETSTFPLILSIIKRIIKIKKMPIMVMFLETKCYVGKFILIMK